MSLMYDNIPGLLWRESDRFVEEGVISEDHLPRVYAPSLKYLHKPH